MLAPLAAAVISEAPRCRVAFTVIVGDAIAQRRSRDVDVAATPRLRIFRLLAATDDARAALSHGRQQPREIVSVRVDRVGEVEAATAALRTGDDQQVGEAVAMQAEERLSPLGFPLLLEGAAAAAGDHVEGRGAHPLEPGRVDQHVERIFDPLMDSAALVDLAYAARCGVD